MEEALITLDGVIHVSRVRGGILETTPLPCTCDCSGVIGLSTVEILSTEASNECVGDQIMTAGLVVSTAHRAELLVLRKRELPQQRCVKLLSHGSPDVQFDINVEVPSLSPATATERQDEAPWQYPSIRLPLTLPTREHAQAHDGHSVFIIPGPLIIALHNGHVSIGSLIFNPKSSDDWCKVLVAHADDTTCTVTVRKVHDVQHVLHHGRLLCVMHLELEHQQPQPNQGEFAGVTGAGACSRGGSGGGAEGKMWMSHECVVFDIFDMHESIAVFQNTAAAARLTSTSRSAARLPPAIVTTKTKLSTYFNVHPIVKFSRPNLTAFALSWMPSTAPILRQQRLGTFCALTPDAPFPSRTTHGEEVALVAVRNKKMHVVSCTCTAAGLITTYSFNGSTSEVHMTKQLPLMLPMRVQRVAICPGEAGHDDPLLIIFCCPTANSCIVSASDTAITTTTNTGAAMPFPPTPFALVLRLITLEFLLEVRKARDAKYGYFHSDLHASLLWLPATPVEAVKAAEPAIHSSSSVKTAAKACPTLTTLPVSSLGTKLLKPDGAWKDVACGSAISLHANKIPRSQYTDSSIARTADTSVGTAHQSKKKRKAVTPVTADAAVPSGLNMASEPEHIQRVQPNLPTERNTENRAKDSRVSFAEIAQAKQHAILAALHSRLQKIQDSTRLMQDIEAQKRVELTSLRATVAAALRMIMRQTHRSRGHEERQMTPLSQIAHKHVPLFPAHHDALKKDTKMNHATSSTNMGVVSTLKSHGSISVYDCICICDARSFSLLIIVRAFNTDSLPVFDASVTCSISDLNVLKGNLNSILSCVSAVADLVSPQQEIWLSARVALSPTHFLALADSAGRLYLNIGINWRELNVAAALSCSASTENSNSLFNEEKAVRKSFLDTFRRDETRAGLEVRNGWIGSNTRGVIGAIVPLTADDMHNSQHCVHRPDTTSLAAKKGKTQEKCDLCGSLAPFVLARTYSQSRMHGDTAIECSGEAGAGADRHWARGILAGWLNGRAEQYKPMPSVMSRWAAPQGGIRYCSYTSGIDFMLVPSASLTADVDRSDCSSIPCNDESNSAMSINAVLQFLEEKYEEHATGHNSICFVPQKASSSCGGSNNTALDSFRDADEEKNLLLRIIPELAPPESCYVNRVITSAVSPRIGGVPAKMLAPILPHSSMGGNDGPMLRARTSAILGLAQLQASLPPDIACVPVCATENRLDKLRLAVVYLIEELKSWATMCRMHRLRAIEESNASTRNLHSHFPSSGDIANNKYKPTDNKTHAWAAGSVPIALVSVGRDLFATPVIANQCKQQRMQADIAAIFAVEA